MSYSIKQLADLSGVTVRALRWYDKLGLLHPTRQANGYRVYTQRDVNRLQQILFYRELEVPLNTIAKLLEAGELDSMVLREHLDMMKNKRHRLDRIIATMEETLTARKGAVSMQDADKFAAFKNQALRQNEELYGSEIRQKYGDEAVNASYQKYAAHTEQQHQQLEQLSAKLADTLRAAVKEGNPESRLAREAAELHKQWLCYYWPDYSPEKHKGVTQMYLDDARFMAYYEAIAPGAAQFLRDAVWAWLGELHNSV